MKTLLEKAKEVKVARIKSMKIPKEVMQVVLAWVKDEISYKQASAVLGNGSNLYGIVATTLKGAYLAGKIKIT